MAEWLRAERSSWRPPRRPTEIDQIFGLFAAMMMMFLLLLVLYPSRSILLIFRMLTSLYKHTRVEAQNSTMYGTESGSNGARNDEGGLAHARLSLFNRGALDCIDRCQDKNVPNKCAHSITGNVQVVDSGREAQKVNALRLSFPFT